MRLPPMTVRALASRDCITVTYQPFVGTRRVVRKNDDRQLNPRGGHANQSAALDTKQQLAGLIPGDGSRHHQKGAIPQLPVSKGGAGSPGKNLAGNLTKRNAASVPVRPSAGGDCQRFGRRP